MNHMRKKRGNDSKWEKKNTHIYKLINEDQNFKKKNTLSTWIEW